MTGNLSAFLYNEDFLKYYFGASHPFQPGRVRKTKELLEAWSAPRGCHHLNDPASHRERSPHGA